jgi:hypothetical protein
MLLSTFLLFTLAAGGQGAVARFDGIWNTSVTCDAKGGTLGYAWHFASTVTDNMLHGERGTPGQQAFLAIDGKIANDGNAKLTATGITAGAQYTHAPIKTEGQDYSYEVKSEFTATEGKGERSTGLGIVGRPCHFVFEKRPATGAAANQSGT